MAKARLLEGDNWALGSGESHTVRSPSTGEQLGSLVLAAPADLHDAASVAQLAQREWAERPYTERAAVLRRAGDLWLAHASEITGWLAKETGAIEPFGRFQVKRRRRSATRPPR